MNSNYLTCLYQPDWFNVQTICTGRWFSMVGKCPNYLLDLVSPYWTLTKPFNNHFGSENFAEWFVIWKSVEGVINNLNKQYWWKLWNQKNVEVFLTFNRMESLQYRFYLRINIFKEFYFIWIELREEYSDGLYTSFCEFSW